MNKSFRIEDSAFQLPPYGAMGYPQDKGERSFGPLLVGIAVFIFLAGLAVAAAVAICSCPGWQCNSVFGRVETALGRFEHRPEIRYVDEVRRSGRTGPPAQPWTGRLDLSGEHTVVEMRTNVSDEEVQFYLALARLHERQDGGTKLMRTGVAHMLRNDRAVDSYAVSYLRRSMQRAEKERILLRPGEDLNPDRFAVDTAYRERYRATAWATAYYLHKIKGRTFEDILRIPASGLPDIEEHVHDLVKPQR